MANGQIKGAGNALDSYKYLKVQVGSFDKSEVLVSRIEWNNV
jgi:hypothetical protein